MGQSHFLTTNTSSLPGSAPYPRSAKSKKTNNHKRERKVFLQKDKTYVGHFSLIITALDKSHLIHSSKMGPAQTLSPGFHGKSPNLPENGFICKISLGNGVTAKKLDIPTILKNHLLSSFRKLCIGLCNCMQLFQERLFCKYTKHRT